MQLEDNLCNSEIQSCNASVNLHVSGRGTVVEDHEHAGIANFTHAHSTYSTCNAHSPKLNAHTQCSPWCVGGSRPTWRVLHLTNLTSTVWQHILAPAWKARMSCQCLHLPCSVQHAWHQMRVSTFGTTSRAAVRHMGVNAQDKQPVACKGHEVSFAYCRY